MKHTYLNDKGISHSSQSEKDKLEYSASKILLFNLVIIHQ